MTAPPPHDKPAEEALIGALLVKPRQVMESLGTLAPSDFYVPAHSIIFEMVQAILTEHPEEDPGTGIVTMVTGRLKDQDRLKEIGGAVLLVDLQAGAPSVSGAAGFARRVADKARMRELGNAGIEITGLANGSTNVAEAAGKALELVKTIVEASNHDLSMFQLHDLLDEHLDLLERRQAGEVPGLMTGWLDLDEILGGLRAGDLCVVGARPAMGKSLLGLNFAEHVAKNGGNVLFASLEMSRAQLLDRLYASTGTIDHTLLFKGRMSQNEWDRVAFASTQLGDYGIYIADNPHLSMAEIHALAKRPEKLDLIVIDYLQLVTPRKGLFNKEQEVNDMAWAAKIMARELNVPVVLLSQLSRKVEDRMDKRPISSDLRDSGGIEQHADKILFLYRDEVYDPMSPKKGIVEVIVDKNRTGPSKVSVELAFLGHQARIANMAKIGDAGRGSAVGPPPPSRGDRAADALLERLNRN